ncbi:MAG: DUF3048 domain-containing protein [Clostridia bacterium]|nr:DUF3048 domain-containing protein [Clostridia bacterium]
MKKLISVILALTLILSFAACGKKEPVTEDKTPVTSTQKEEEPKNEFVSLMEQDNRPVAVMIDNDGPSSRPQIGLESAYMIYEVIVEGGASRIMALFKDASDIEKVGPIRSSRHYFLDYALEHDAIYCHAGWSPKAASDISSLGVNNVNGITGADGGKFYRDYTYDRTWHNLYTDLNKLYEHAIDTKGYNDKTDVKHTSYNEKDTDISGGTPATEIVLPYSTMYKVTYKYNPETKTYTRYIGQSEHMSQTGEALTAKNIIVYSVRNYDLADGENKGRQEVETVGSGTGYYITNGSAAEITWSKSSRKDRTIYKDASGNEIKLNPGNTYVHVVPMSSQITIN